MRVQSELAIIWAVIFLLTSIIWTILLFNTPLFILHFFEIETESATPAVPTETSSMASSLSTTSTKATTSASTTKLATACGTEKEMFHIAPKLKTDWYNASAYCRSIDMQLIEILSEEKQVKVEKMIIDNGLSTESFWTSGTKLGFNKFYWFYSGTKFTYLYWVDGEPNNLAGKQQCMRLQNEIYFFQWDDDQCTKEYHVMCEKSNSAETNRTTDFITEPSVVNDKYRIAPPKLNWHEAKKYCQSIDMKLIEVSTQEKQEDVVKTIKNAGYIGSFWIAETELYSEIFYWFNTDKKFQLTMWANQSEANKMKISRHCIALREEDFKWVNDICRKYKWTMCEKSNVMTTKGLLDSNNSIALGKYVVSQSKGNWHKANAFCHSIGMHLIEVSTEEKYEDVKETIEGDFQFSYTSFWTSGTRLGSDQFYWFNTGKNFKFTYWASGEPNDADGNQECMRLNLDDHLQWDDYCCDCDLRIMCEK